MLLCGDMKVKNWNPFKMRVAEKSFFRHFHLGLKIVAD